MLEIHEAVQQLLNQRVAQVVQEAQQHQKFTGTYESPAVNRAGEDPTPQWNICYDTWCG